MGLFGGAALVGRCGGGAATGGGDNGEWANVCAGSAPGRAGSSIPEGALVELPASTPGKGGAATSATAVGSTIVATGNGEAVGGGMAAAVGAADTSASFPFLASMRNTAAPMPPTSSSDATATSGPLLFGTAVLADESPLRLIPDAVPMEAACTGPPPVTTEAGCMNEAGTAGARSEPAQAARSAPANSWADPKRSGGSRAHARWNQPSREGGSHGAFAQRLGRGAVQICSSKSPKDSLEKARFPVNSVYATRPKRIEVRSVVDGLEAARLLGTHVERRTEQRARPRGTVIIRSHGELRDPEVEDLDQVGVVVGATREEDVVRLDVAMNDAGRVSAPERLAALDEDLDGLLQRHGAGAVNSRIEVLPAEKLHGDVRRPVVERPVVEHLDDVTRAQLGGRLRLGVEASERLGGADELPRDELDRDGLPEPRVGRGPDGPHPALADDGLEPVLTGDDCSRRNERGRRSAHQTLPLDVTR